MKGWVPGALSRCDTAHLPHRWRMAPTHLGRRCVGREKEALGHGLHEAQTQSRLPRGAARRGAADSEAL